MYLKFSEDCHIYVSKLLMAYECKSSSSSALRKEKYFRLLEGITARAFESREITLPMFVTELNLPHVPSEGSLSILCVSLSK
jgi:hypothetical protein